MANIDSSYLQHLSHMQPQLYWLDADPLEPQPHPTLIGETTTDLCIVGAGYTGLWTALLAKEANPERDVIIIEPLETGAGASGRNGGFCSYSLTHGFMNGYSRFKDEMAIIELGLRCSNSIHPEHCLLPSAHCQLCDRYLKLPSEQVLPDVNQQQLRNYAATLRDHLDLPCAKCEMPYPLLQLQDRLSRDQLVQFL